MEGISVPQNVSDNEQQEHQVLQCEDPGNEAQRG